MNPLRRGRPQLRRASIGASLALGASIAAISAVGCARFDSLSQTESATESAGHASDAGKANAAGDAEVADANDDSLGVPVLVFHGICATTCAPDEIYNMTTEEFGRVVVATRSSGFEPIAIDTYVRIMHGDKSGVKGRPILYTFDDGRADAYASATPIPRGVEHARDDVHHCQSARVEEPVLHDVG